MIRSLLCLLFVALSLLSSTATAQAKKEYLYVGTFSVRGSQGVYVYTFNRAKKSFSLVQTVTGLESPSFLGIHPTRKFLYSVNRGKASENETGGSVTAYTVDQKNGKLTALNTRSSFGADPCHISFDKTGQYSFVSNYNEGNLVVLPLFEDGLIGNPSDSKKYTGNSINPDRQQSSHLHSALISPDNNFLYAADLGTDKIYIYTFNLKKGTLDDSKQKEVTVKPGTGPRHFAFHPSGNYMYVAEELTSTVATFKVDKKTGSLTILQDSVLSLPKTFTGKNTSADIHVDPKGKFLYMSNRGYNGLSIYTIGADGKVKLVGQQTTGGSTPRNFMIDSKGEYIFVAHQDSDTIAIFRINAKTGKLSPVGKPLKVPAPVCLKMISLG